MAVEIEKENTYLLGKLPVDEIQTWKKELVRDTYYPADADHPQIRLRRRGAQYRLTKKYPMTEDDRSTMIEETLKLSPQEGRFFERYLKGKSLAKNRYSKDFGDYLIEIDEYLDKLRPLIVLDIEWKNRRGDANAIAKRFGALKEITHTEALAAGKIVGKSYDDIQAHV